jgi:hypothetical protein
MSCNVIPFFLRDVTSYRMWLSKTADPHVLRDVGLCACDDLEESLKCIENLPETKQSSARNNSSHHP